MKKLFCFIFCFFSLLTPVFAGVLPQIVTAVTDEPDVLTPAEESMLTTDLENLKNQTGVQMALLVIKTTDGIPIEDYSIQVAQTWQGGTKGRDDGLLYVLAVNDRKMRLETGYGLEAVIPDALALQILDQVKDDLRSEKYYVAFTKVIAQIEKKISFIKPDIPIGRPPPLLGERAYVYWIVFFLGALSNLISLYGSRVFKNGEFFKKNFWKTCGLYLLPMVIIGFVFYEGSGFWWAYPLIYIAGYVASILIENEGKQKSKFPVYVWFAALFIMAPLLMILRGEAHFDEPSGIGVLIYALAHVFLALLITVPILFFRRLYLGLTGQGWGAFGGSGGSSGSTGRNSWSGGSYRSSSSSGSSWSGGGGSFGGGGASSSW